MMSSTGVSPGRGIRQTSSRSLFLKLERVLADLPASGSSPTLENRVSCSTRACPPRIPIHTRASSQHMHSYGKAPTPFHSLSRSCSPFGLAGPRLRGDRRGHCGGALHEPARPAQGQIPSVDARARGRHRTRHLARPPRHTRFRGLAWALSWPWSERCGKRQQLGALLSLVRIFFYLWGGLNFC